MLRTFGFCCAVTAVTPATPRTFMSCRVCRSREMPAPPLESEPPITSTVGLAFGTSIPRREERNVVMAGGTKTRGCAPGSQAGAAAEDDAGLFSYALA